MANEWFDEVTSQEILNNFSFNYDRLLSNGTRKNNSIIYVIRVGEFYKIGRTINLSKRISAYSTHCPYKIDPIYTVEVEYGIEFEQLLHNIFSCFLHRGEWFTLSSHALEMLSVVIKKYGNKKNVQ